MNKALLLLLAAAALLGTSLNAESMYTKFQAMEDEMSSLKKEVSALKRAKKASIMKEDEAAKSDSEEELAQSDSEEDDEDKMDVEGEIEYIYESLTELNKATSGNHLKFGIDYRFALENLQYKMADGSEKNNDAFMTNRLWVNMDWAANDNLSFTGQLAYNKAFGQRSISANRSLEGFDWVANENAYDDTMRVRSAYFLYRNNTFLETEIPWTFSIGRRPSTNGHLINLRDDDRAASPMGHTINVEFDGLSSKFSFNNWVDGMYVKFCAGRGMSNAAPKFASDGASYSTDTTPNPDIDLVGLIFVPYDDGHYAVATQYYYANNLIDQNMTTGGFDTVGGLHSTTVNFKANGIGDEISYFLDDTTFFISGAWSVTNPDANERMLGGDVGERLNGYSVWTGLQFPSLISDYGRWGLEYNHGSQYWRSITYAEDTNVGSKMATRGNAYEAYFTEYLVDDILSLQVRYTYIDYEYTGSNGFFGNTSGNSMKISDLSPAMAAQTVDTAQDIRFYIRYKY